MSFHVACIADRISLRFKLLKFYIKFKTMVRGPLQHRFSRVGVKGERDVAAQEEKLLSRDTFVFGGFKLYSRIHIPYIDLFGGSSLLM